MIQSDIFGLIILMGIIILVELYYSQLKNLD